MISSKVIEISSGRPGPALAIFAGVHGNELAGVYALQELLPTLRPTRGKLFVAFANPPAIEANVRMLNKNLNRCFASDNNGVAPEDERARELMKVLDKCDALLDLHMFYGDDGLPFVICEDNALDIAQKFDVDILSTNWATAEPGATDGYMYETGKIGICVECGPTSKSREYAGFAKQTIYQFLKYFEMSPIDVPFSDKPKRLVRAKRSVYRNTPEFSLLPGFKNFDRLEAGQILATEGHKKYLAEQNECIIFPHYSARIGEEAYIIGEELSPR